MDLFILNPFRVHVHLLLVAISQKARLNQRQECLPPKYVLDNFSHGDLKLLTGAIMMYGSRQKRCCAF